MTPLLLAVLSWHFNWRFAGLVFAGTAATLAFVVGYLFALARLMVWMDRRFGLFGSAVAIVLGIALVLAVVIGFVEPAHSSTLSWTAPSFHATAGSCLPSQDAIVDPESVYVWRQQQSPTWLAMRPAMTAFPAVWALIMPIVRAEAEPRLVAVRAQVPGVRDSVTIPDSTGWFYRAEVIVNGKWSLCPAWATK